MASPETGSAPLRASRQLASDRPPRSAGRHPLGHVGVGEARRRRDGAAVAGDGPQPERRPGQEVLGGDEHQRPGVGGRAQQAADEPHVVVQRQPRDAGRRAPSGASRGPARPPWPSSAAWVSATGFGSTVEPDENWTSASVLGRRQAQAAPAPVRPRAGPRPRSPSGGRARSTALARGAAAPARRRSPRRAPETWSMRAVAREVLVHAGPAAPAGRAAPAPPRASSAPKNASRKAGSVRSTMRHPVARRDARGPRARRRRRAARSKTSPQARQVSLLVAAPRR